MTDPAYNENAVRTYERTAIFIGDNKSPPNNPQSLKYRQKQAKVV